MAAEVKKVHLLLECTDDIREVRKKYFGMHLPRKDPSRPIPKTRQKIGIKDLLLSRGQHEYSIAQDLLRTRANITIGQLPVHCPFLQQELRTSINIRKRTKAVYACRADKDRGANMQAPQVEAIINGNTIIGCLVDGRATVNIMAS